MDFGCAAYLSLDPLGRRLWEGELPLTVYLLTRSVGVFRKGLPLYVCLLTRSVGGVGDGLRLHGYQTEATVMRTRCGPGLRARLDAASLGSPSGAVAIENSYPKSFRLRPI